jgi:alkylation response protein AidB-like acyl-CoA dehydrogenase
MTSLAPASPRSEHEAVARAAGLSRAFALTAREVDRTAAFPFANFDALHAAGLLNLTVPESHGGMGAGIAATCEVVGLVAQGEPSTALVLAMHYIYHAVGRGAPWNPDAHALLCRESLEGIALINHLRAEPELGTPARGGLPATTAVRTANGWRISGHKIYATGSPLLKYGLAWGKADGPDPQVGIFVVPLAAPGARIVETWDHLGMRATGSHDLIMDDVELPPEFALDLRTPQEWQSRPDPVQATWNNLVLSALYNGIAVAARDWLTRYLHERQPSNLGASLATLPRMQSAVGEIDALLFTNERLIGGLARDTDAGVALPPGATSLAKYTVTNNAVRAVDIALALVGNPGLSRTNDLERHHRDVLCSRIHVPQDDMVLLGAGRLALGIT